MNVDRRTGTVASDAIEREIRGAALDRALLAADEKFGAVADELIATSEAELSQWSRPRRRSSKRR